MCIRDSLSPVLQHDLSQMVEIRFVISVRAIFVFNLQGDNIAVSYTHLGGRFDKTQLLSTIYVQWACDHPAEVSYAVIETNGTLSAALRPEKEPARLADLQLKVTHTNATIPFVLDGQVLEDNLRWCGKDRAWLERTAQANTLLPEEILLLVGNETEDYFLLKKESRRKGRDRQQLRAEGT